MKIERLKLKKERFTLCIRNLIFVAQYHIMKKIEISFGKNFKHTGKEDWNDSSGEDTLIRSTDGNKWSINSATIIKFCDLWTSETELD